MKKVILMGNSELHLTSTDVTIYSPTMKEAKEKRKYVEEEGFISKGQKVNLKVHGDDNSRGNAVLA